jgi:ribosome-associated toxin RatA of RatAB toxin-antitoxin module
VLDAGSDIEVHAPADAVFAVIWDVKRYPEFLTDVVETSVREIGEPGVQDADFEVQLVRIRRYTLRMVADPPRGVQWTLLEGESLRENVGSWQVLPHTDGHTCLVSYRIRVDFNLPVPDVIVRKIVEHNLPMMLRQFKARIEQLHRRTLS